MNPSVIKSIESQIERTAKFLGEYTWLVNAYVSDYFVLEHWCQVKSNWWQCLSEAEPAQLASLLHAPSPTCRQLWPLSLLAYQATVASLALNRAPQEPDNASLLQKLHSNPSLLSAHGSSPLQSEASTSQHAFAGSRVTGNEDCDSTSEITNSEDQGQVNKRDSSCAKSSCNTPQEAQVQDTCDTPQEAQVQYTVCDTPQEAQVQYTVCDTPREAQVQDTCDTPREAQVQYTVCDTPQEAQVQDTCDTQREAQIQYTVCDTPQEAQVQYTVCNTPREAQVQYTVCDTPQETQVQDTCDTPREAQVQDSCDTLRVAQVQDSCDTLRVAQVQDGQHMLLEHCYRRHVKPKKQHEILQLGQIISQLCQLCQCHHVIDVGAGQGHLSRVLSFGHGLKVTTVEAAGGHVPKAEKFDGEVKDDIVKGRIFGRKKKKNDVNPPPQVDGSLLSQPDHVIATIEPDIEVGTFLRTLRLCHTSALDDKETEAIRGGSAAIKTSQLPVAHDGSAPCLEKTLGEQESQQGNILSDDSHGSVKIACEPSVGATENVPVSKHGPSNAAGDAIKAIEHKMLPNPANHLRIDADDPGVSDTGQQSVNRDWGSTVEAGRFTLTGLHACGDLTPTMLRVFVKCPQAVGLASVACCYMKMSAADGRTGSTKVKDWGYPMSQFLQRSQPSSSLSYEAREMACHFIDCYYQRLLDGSPSLVSHCYRAALQEIILDKDPDVQHGSIKLTLKKAHLMPFKDYAAKALGRLGLEPSLSAEQLSRAEGRLLRWREVVAFYTLRLSLAPVVESLILLDRLLYLLEQGIPSCLVPIFDPKLSPRNFVLLAKKL